MGKEKQRQKIGERIQINPEKKLIKSLQFLGRRKGPQKVGHI